MPQTKEINLAIDKNLKKKFQIKHPELGPMWVDEAETEPLYIELQSPASDDYLQVMRKLTNKNIFDNKRGAEDSFDKQQDRRVALLVAATSGGNFKYKGAELVGDNAEAFYKDRDFQYIKEEIETVTSSMKSFLQPW